MEHDYLSVVRRRKQLIIKCLLTQSLEVRKKIVSAGILRFLCVSCLLERLFVSPPSVWKGMCVPLLKEVLHSLPGPSSTCCFIRTFLISRLYLIGKIFRRRFFRSSHIY